MDFDEILNKISPAQRDSLTNQALKRQEYNRRYQARLRERSKLITLQKKIDSNLTYVLAYIKSKYPKEYEAYTFPTKTSKLKTPVSEDFKNWLLLSQNEYRGIKYAYEISGLEDKLPFKVFSELFERCFVEDENGKFKKTIDML